MGETPLALRRRKLALHYAAKLYGYERQDHPGRQLVEACWEWGRGGGGESRSFVYRVGVEEELGLSWVWQGTAVVWPSVPAWLLPNVEVDLTVAERMRQEGRGDPEKLSKAARMNAGASEQC
ncbi:hypothetical protein GJAV_G00086740 [Gymnothorax javanicus]|nr:hypothetical protein GJAV_G00086740 [Gymnothorax javanicus]